MISMSGKCFAGFGPTPNAAKREITSEFMKELTYDTNVLEVQVNEITLRLLPKQHQVYKTILNNVKEGLFFLDTPAGTGKMFVLNLLLAQLPKGHYIALAAPSSGVAATLLNTGRTVHPVLKLALNLMNAYTLTCNIIQKLRPESPFVAVQVDSIGRVPNVAQVCIRGVQFLGAVTVKSSKRKTTLHVQPF